MEETAIQDKNKLLDERKLKILNIIKTKGPVLPVQISREIKLDSLFASAILSEMVSTKELKLSYLKIGGSPLYYLPGQENMLENFSKFMPSKEKEVFDLLKKHRILEDSRLHPAHRVAIRSVKDFAIPMKISEGNEEKILWRLYSISLEDCRPQIDKLIKKPRKRAKDKKEVKKAKIKDKEEKKKKFESPLKKEKEKSEFVISIQNYLRNNNITVLEEKEVKKKEFTAMVLVSSSVGKMQMLLISKDKKRISDGDLSLAFSKGQEMKLPVLYLTKGNLSKKAEKQLENFKNLLIFKEL